VAASSGGGRKGYARRTIHLTDKDARDRANRESSAAQLKLYGDIVKNVAPKFPSDFADIPIFIESIEKLIDSVKVPVELRAKLLLPHLSEYFKYYC